MWDSNKSFAFEINRNVLGGMGKPHTLRVGLSHGTLGNYCFLACELLKTCTSRLLIYTEKAMPLPTHLLPMEEQLHRLIGWNRLPSFCEKDYALYLVALEQFRFT